MVTKKDRKMTFTIWPLGAILLISVLLLVPATQAMAEEVKYKHFTYITKVEIIPVGDTKGHRVGVFERRGLALFEDGEVAAYLIRGTFDFTKQGGPGNAYFQITYKDGSTILGKAPFTMALTPGEKLPSVKSKGQYIKGTGRFEGIKGTFTCSGQYITPYTTDKTKGDLCFECTSTRTLPSK